METKASLCIFLFRMLPWEASLGFNFEELPLTDDFVAECVRDQLFLRVDWQRAEPFDELKDRAKALASALVDAHSYVGYPDHRPVDVEWIGWLEVKDCIHGPIITGYGHSSQKDAPIDSTHPSKAVFENAARLIRDYGSNKHIRIALSDFRSGRHNPTAYASFYAFRVLEDVGFSFGRTKADKPDWNAMNSAFDIDDGQAYWKELTKAGTAARHLTAQALDAPAPNELRSLFDLAKKSIDYLVTHLGANRSSNLRE